MPIPILIIAAISLATFFVLVRLSIDRQSALYMLPAAIVMLCVGIIGGSHAWLESQSIGWTAVYAAIGLTGLLSPFAFKLFKKPLHV